MELKIRSLESADVSAVLSVQADAYLPELLESGETFARKINLFPRGCLGCFEGENLLGYVFSQPWYGTEIIPLDAHLSEIPALPDCYYIHDLAIRKAGRARGIGRRLIDSLFIIADSLGIQRFMLVSVQSSEPFWQRWGFVARRSFEYAAGIEATLMELRRPVSFLISEAAESDVDEIFSLGMNEPAFKVSEKISFYEHTELIEWVKHPRENILLVARPKSGDDLAGFLFCKVISHHWAMLDNYFVKRQFRGQGCGKLLLVELSSQLRKRGIEYLSTLANVLDVQLLEMLSRFGFKQQKTYSWFDAPLVCAQDSDVNTNMEGLS